MKKLRYSESLIMAVKYLLEKGFNTREISRRLDVSPNTVRTIKYLLRKQKILKKEQTQKKKTKKAMETRAKPKKSKDFIEKVLGGGM